MNQPIRDPDLKQLIDDITVDTYGDAERASSFHTAFDDHVELPTEAQIIGVTVTVHEFDIGGDGTTLTARCSRGTTEEWLSLVDLEFPADSPAAWVHAAYRYDLGMKPYPSAMPEDWKLNWA
ncbi:MAG: hypothetical protein FWD11_11835 [Micrococcales bacterium]|nr:hypothetical protein [Micrococcales bacterium]